MSIIGDELLTSGAYSRRILSYAPLAYWPLWEPSGITAYDLSGNGFNGTYTGVTLGQTGIGDGNTCPLFNGVGGFVNVYSVGLRDAFPTAEGALMAWVRVNAAARWTDGSERRVANLGVNDLNRVVIRKNSANNRFDFIYTAGGAEQQHTLNAFWPTVWFCAAIAWSKNADTVRAYINGGEVAAPIGGLGNWAGQIGATTSLIGAGTSIPIQLWFGYIAHVALFSSPLSNAAFAKLGAL